MSRRLLLVLALVALATVVAAVLVSLLAPQPERVAPLVEIPIGVIWIVAGLIAWVKRPENRTGALMTALGFLFLASHLSWDAPLPFTLGVLIETWGIAVAIHLVVAFPAADFRRASSARSLRPRTSRGSWATWFGNSSGTRLTPVVRIARATCSCSRAIPAYPRVGARGSPVRLGDRADGVRSSHQTVAPCDTPARRAIAPVGWAAIGLGLLLAAFTVWLGVTSGDPSGSLFSWVVVVAAAAVPLAFLAGLLRTRLHRSAVAELVVELGSLPRPSQVRDAIARTLGDPSLELAFWLPDEERYVDPNGNALVPEAEPARAVTVLEHDGTRLAALVHDPSLLDDPELVQAVGAAATALENARLQAELRAQLAEVRASRARIVEAGDAERRARPPRRGATAPARDPARAPARPRTSRRRRRVGRRAPRRGGCRGRRRSRRAARARARHPPRNPHRGRPPRRPRRSRGVRRCQST